MVVSVCNIVSMPGNSINHINYGKGRYNQPRAACDPEYAHYKAYFVSGCIPGNQPAAEAHPAPKAGKVFQEYMASFLGGLDSQKHGRGISQQPEAGVQGNASCTKKYQNQAYDKITVVY